MSRNKYPEETVNLILDVSQRLFLEKGYEHTTIQDIIDNLGGLTKGAIYHHFKSKEEILNAVIDRLFSDNTLSAKWLQIKNDSALNGGEKLKEMFYEAIVDEQEQKLRKMGINLQKMPQMLADLLIRQVTVIAHDSFEPVIEEGVKDGSISFPYPKELAEIISLLANIWINPLVFKMSDEEMKRKFEVLCEMTKMFGVDVSQLYSTLDNMNKEINKKPIK